MHDGLSLFETIGIGILVAAMVGIHITIALMALKSRFFGPHLSQSSPDQGNDPNDVSGF